MLVGPIKFLFVLLPCLQGDERAKQTEVFGVFSGSASRKGRAEILCHFTVGVGVNHVPWLPWD